MDVRDDGPRTARTTVIPERPASHRDLYADHGVADDATAELADHLTRWLP